MSNKTDAPLKTEPCSNLHEVEFESLNVDFKDVIGHGSYGTVYKGNWVETDIAVKVIKRSISYKNDVLREAQLHATLRHPNIVTLMGISLRKKDIAFVTEFVNGNSMQYYIDEEITLSDEVTSKLISGVQGVAYLHEVMVIHGDLKPANILVSQDMQAKICDFGLGKVRQKLSVTSSVTVNGSIHGTISFLPPECLIGQKHTDFRSDVWSLGITLAEFLTHGAAWEDVFAAVAEGKSELDKLKSAMKDHKLPSICETLPTKWKPMIESCLNYTPSFRAKAKDLVFCYKDK